jgi:hypothetical protein
VCINCLIESRLSRRLVSRLRIATKTSRRAMPRHRHHMIWVHALHHHISGKCMSKLMGVNRYISRRLKFLNDLINTVITQPLTPIFWASGSTNLGNSIPIVGSALTYWLLTNHRNFSKCPRSDTQNYPPTPVDWYLSQYGANEL